MSGCLNTVFGHWKTGTVLAVLMVYVALVHSAVDAAPVAVRFQEGKTHGFLLVRSLAGDIIGQGEMTQVAKEGDLVESQLVFTFKDGSLYDEKVAFSQHGVLTLISYHLVQRGPFFPEQADVFVDRGTGTYKVRSQIGEDGKEEVRTGTVDLSKDVYNGMVITSLLNLPKGAGETVHILAFRPEPEVIKLQLLPRGEGTVRIGDWSRRAWEYEFKPDIGIIRKWLGRITGNLPDDFHYHCWILADDVPSFVRYEGPLQLMGPIVRIELVSPGLLTKPEDRKISSR
jgi:hypothetical protein